MDGIMFTYRQLDEAFLIPTSGHRQSWLFPADFGPILGYFGLFKTKSWLSPADISSYRHGLSVSANRYCNPGDCEMSVPRAIRSRFFTGAHTLYLPARAINSRAKTHLVSGSGETIFFRFGGRSTLLHHMRAIEYKVSSF